MSLPIYESLLEKYHALAAKQTRTLRSFSLIRLITFLTCLLVGYYFFRQHYWPWLVVSAALLIIFFVLIRLYDRLKDRLSLSRALATINQKEIDQLKGLPLTYPAGKEYIDPKHPFSYDLDLFGQGSLYQFLNRCSTLAGQEHLADTLLHPKSDQIVARQEAIAELSQRIEFRQNLQATGDLHPLAEKNRKELDHWITAGPIFKRPFLFYSLLIVPVLTIGSLVVYFINEQAKALDLFYTLFTLDIFILFLFARKLMGQLSASTSVNTILEQVAIRLQAIEQEDFKSSFLQQLQSDLKKGPFLRGQVDWRADCHL